MSFSTDFSRFLTASGVQSTIARSVSLKLDAKLKKNTPLNKAEMALGRAYLGAVVPGGDALTKRLASNIGGLGVSSAGARADLGHKDWGRSGLAIKLGHKVSSGLLADKALPDLLDKTSAGRKLRKSDPAEVRQLAARVLRS